MYNILDVYVDYICIDDETGKPANFMIPSYIPNILGKTYQLQGKMYFYPYSIEDNTHEDISIHDPKYIDVYIPYGFVHKGYKNAIREAENINLHPNIMECKISYKSLLYSHIKNHDEYTLRSDDNNTPHNKCYITPGKPEIKSYHIDINVLNSSVSGKHIGVIDTIGNSAYEAFIPDTIDIYDSIYENHRYKLINKDGEFYLTEVYTHGSK